MAQDRLRSSVVQHHQVYSTRQARQRARAGHTSAGEQGGHCAIEVTDLVPVDPPFRRPEPRMPLAANFDQGQLSGRTGVDAEQIDLVAADSYVTRQDRPSCPYQMSGNHLFGT